MVRFRDTHAGLSNADLSRVSEFLMIQLASISKHGTYNTFSITDVIQELEGVGRGCKQRVQQFKYLPLKGFWKAHFFDARFIPRNLINHWGLEFENSPKFDNLYDDIVKQEKDSPSSDGGHGQLAYAMIIGGYEECLKSRQFRKSHLSRQKPKQSQLLRQIISSSVANPLLSH